MEELNKIEGIDADVSKGTITYNGKTYDVSEVIGSTNEQKAVEANGVKQITTANANEEEKELLENENVRMIIKEGDSTNDEETIKAIIPKGFYYVTGKPSTGLVISDKFGDDDNNSKGGNQFVWIPCNGNSGITYERTKDESTKFGLASQWTDTGKQYYYNTPEKYTDWTDYGGAKDGDTIDSVDSVQKYGGFYVARFEAGVPENADFYAKESNNYAYATDKNNTSLKPVSRKNNQSWNRISQRNAKVVSQNMYANSSIVSSQLIDSFAWDTTVSWLKTEVSNIGQNSTDYGNYINSNSKIEIKNTLYSLHHYIEQKNPGAWITYETNKKYYKGNINLGRKLIDKDEKEKHQFYYCGTDYNFTDYNHYLWVELPTGAYEAEIEENGTKKTVSSKVKNIYDMAGNMWEWTTEVGNHSTSATIVAQENVATAKYGVVRGGSFHNYGSAYPVSTRNGPNETAWSKTTIGFRVVLYLR